MSIRTAFNNLMQRRFPRTDDSVVTEERLVQLMRTLYNPLPELNPLKLRQALDNFDAGYLKNFYLIAHQMIATDDTLGNVADKRHRAPSTRGYEIIPDDESQDAQDHAAALEYFYDNLSTVDAVDPDHVGGVELLITQMMEAVSYKYANHEIVWQPSVKGITAEMRYCPLSFFERTTGRLRFLETDTAAYGVDMDPDRWLVTVGPGLMFSCAITYLFKHTPLRDWLIYCSRHGMPGIAGKTSARPGSTEWQAMEDAVSSFAADFAAVMSTGDVMETIDMTSKGELPYAKLIERCDRAMAARYRGADLSTMSAGGGEGTGASLQGDETDIIEAADADMLNGTLRRTIDRRVIWYRFGCDRPRAKVQVRTSPKDTTEQDLNIDETLHRMGYPIILRGISERYGRPLPDDNNPEDTVLPPLPAQAPAAGFSLGPDSPQALTGGGAPMPGTTDLDAPDASVVPLAGEGADLQDMALNGAQVSALMDLLGRISNKELSIDSAVPIIESAFPMISADRIKRIVSPLAKFTPAADVGAINSTRMRVAYNLVAANTIPQAVLKANAYTQAARERLAAGLQADFELLAERLGELLTAIDDEAEDDAIVDALETFRAELPEWVAKLDLEQGAADAMADVLASTLANAMHDNHEAQTGEK